MADIDLVIKIPKSDYEQIKEDIKSMASKHIVIPSLYKTIANGTKVKTGYWVNGEYCSECGCDVPAYIVDWKWEKDIKAKYCPKCGTEMKEKNLKGGV